MATRVWFRWVKGSAVPIPRWRGGAGLVLAALLISACGASASSGSGVGGPGTPSNPVTVRVFGAASLTDAFEDLEIAFESANPGYDIELNLAGSAGLRAQILDGAPVDVFASANELIMDQVVAELSESSDGAVLESPRPFAVNRLEIAVPEGNPGRLVGLLDFDNDELFLGLCAGTVPCGTFANDVLRTAAVEPSVDTREADVRALLTKIATAELDGGIVYATDVQASPDVEGIAIPDDINISAVYPIVVLDQGTSSAGGRAFASFVLADKGQRILADRGFDTP